MRSSQSVLSFPAVPVMRTARFSFMFPADEGYVQEFPVNNPWIEGPSI